jgi:hypothetical protein
MRFQLGFKNAGIYIPLYFFFLAKYNITTQITQNSPRPVHSSHFSLGHLAINHDPENYPDYPVFTTRYRRAFSRNRNQTHKSYPQVYFYTHILFCVQQILLLTGYV